MNNYDMKKIVSKFGIALIALFALFAGNVMISQTNAGARHVRIRRTRRTVERTKIQRRRTKGAYVKRAKRIHKITRHVSKRRGRKVISRVKPRKMKIERRGTDDPVSIKPKKK